MADRVSAWFVRPWSPSRPSPPICLAASADPEPRAAYAIMAAVTVLIIACPCALGLSHTHEHHGRRGARRAGGVLIKNAEALERLESIDTLVVDKTGNPDPGRPEVVAWSRLAVWARTKLLRLAAGLERPSQHPLAEAVVRPRRREGCPCRRSRVLTLRPARRDGTVEGDTSPSATRD
jgi:Cu+-exporting ATPase